MGPIDLVVGQVQGIGQAGKVVVIALFAGQSQLWEGGQDTGAGQQGIAHGLRQGHSIQGHLHGDAQHGIEQGEHANDEGVVHLFGGEHFGRQQLHQAATHHRGLAHSGGGVAAARRGQQQSGPAKELFQAQNHDRMAKRGDLNRQTKTGRIDKAQQVE